MSQIEMTRYYTVGILINELGIGSHKGPFLMTTTGKTTEGLGGYARGSDWQGEAGQIVTVDMVHVDRWYTKVYVDGVGYWQGCFE